MEIELEPFSTPNFCRLKMPPRLRQEGYSETPAIPLKDVPAADLAKLCDQFRAEVFAKSGKTDPGAGDQGGEGR